MKQKLFDHTDIKAREAPDFVIEKAVEHKVMHRKDGAR